MPAHTVQWSVAGDPRQAPHSTGGRWWLEILRGRAVCDGIGVKFKRVRCQTRLVVPALAAPKGRLDSQRDRGRMGGSGSFHQALMFQELQPIIMLPCFQRTCTPSAHRRCQISPENREKAFPIMPRTNLPVHVSGPTRSPWLPSPITSRLLPSRHFTPFSPPHDALLILMELLK